MEAGGRGDLGTPGFADGWRELVSGLPSPAVVVGTDGGAAGLAAVEWAAAEAAARSCDLSIVHAQPALVRAHQRRTGDGPPAHTSSDPLLEEAVGRARAIASDTTVHARSVVGAAVPALLGQRADLLVVGNTARRTGSRSGRPVCLGVAAYAMCPVAVVRLKSPESAAAPGIGTRRRREAGRVVVGIGGSSPSVSMLEFGFRAAAQRRVDLTALVARPPDLVDDVLHEVAPAVGVESLSWPRLVTAIARLRLAFPTVSATTVCRHGSAADVLVEESDGAALLVVGQRDRSVLGRRLFGSVTHSVLNRADCPVAIVRR